MALSASEFLRHLEASCLLAPEEVAVLRIGSDTADLDGQALAVRLVQQGKLTPYQAKQLLAGRWSGFLLGNYKILDALGEGGMGMVFQAEHKTLHRLAAIKVLPPKAADRPEAVRRFYREARAAALLEHESIVRTYDVHQQGHVHYIAMEYVPGQTVHELIKHGGRLPHGAAVGIIYQVALGLEHAFQRGVVHRDIKPANILVTPQGRAKILDMGLARFFGDTAEAMTLQSSLTATGVDMGTVDYMAPEQAEDASRADTRSDIYSLGCTLYACLTGQVPFPEGAPILRLLKHREREPAEICQLAPEVPEPVAAVVRRMMAKRPADRFQTPAEVAQALRPYCLPELVGAGETLVPSRPSVPIPPSQTGGVSPGGRFDRFDALSLFLSDRPSELSVNEVLRAIAAAADVAPLAARSSPRWRHWVATQKPLVGIVATAALLTLALAIWKHTAQTTLMIDWPEAERVGGTLLLDGMPQAVPAEGPLEFRGPSGQRRVRLERPGYEPFEQAPTLIPGGRQAVKPEWKPTEATARKDEFFRLQAEIQKGVPADPEDARTASIRSDLLKLPREYSVTPRKGPRVVDLLPRVPWPADALQQKRISDYELTVAGAGDRAKVPAELVAVLGDSRLRHWDAVVALAYSRDGKLMASGSKDGTVKLWDASTGEELHTLPGSPDGVMALSLDGQTVAARTAEARVVKLWDVATGKELHTIEHPASNVGSVALSPDGQTLALGGYDGSVELWDVAAGEKRGTLAAHTAVVNSVAFSPDGQRLASGSADKTVKLWHVATGEPQHTLEGHQAPVRCVAFSPDGQLLASGADGSDGVKLWDADAAMETHSISLTDWVRCLAFSPDGKSLAAAGSSHRFLVGGVSEDSKWVRRHSVFDPVTYGFHSVAFSPDGKTLSVGSAAGMVEFWDAATGTRQAPLPRSSGFLTSLALSPDGQTLALGDWDGVVKLWSVASGQEPRTVGQHGNGVLCLAFSPDGKWLASGCSSEATLKLWDLVSGRATRILSGHEKSIYCLAFSPDGRWLASGAGDRTVKLWSTATGQARTTLGPLSSYAVRVAFGPDGKLLASGTQDGTVRFWDVASGREQGKVQLERSSLSCLAFSPDGQALATDGEGSTVKLWSVPTGHDQSTLEAPGGRTTAVAFSHDGRTLASGTEDGFVRLWDPHHPYRDPRTLRIGPPRGSTRLLIFTPEGRHLIRLNGNGTVFVLRLDNYEVAQAK